jgi:hypothetical protein
MKHLHTRMCLTKYKVTSFRFWTFGLWHHIVLWADTSFPLKHLYLPTKLHNVTQKMTMLTVIAMKTVKLTDTNLICIWHKF